MLSRIGEINYNTFGSKMEIIAYRSSIDLDIYFEKYDWIFKNARYSHFNEGKIRCPYERRFYNIGYIGVGKHKATVNRKNTKAFSVWMGILERCYDNKGERQCYNDCLMEEEWHNFQNFAEWYYNNDYECNNETLEVDKDILFKGNKIYSPKTCLLVPHEINKLFIKQKTQRGNLPIGVRIREDIIDKKYNARCRYKGKSVHLGYYKTIEEAFYVYKNFKEKVIKEVADEYKDLIPKELYEAMYKYEVEITD